MGSLDFRPLRLVAWQHQLLHSTNSKNLETTFLQIPRKVGSSSWNLLKMGMFYLPHVCSPPESSIENICNSAPESKFTVSCLVRGWVCPCYVCINARYRVWHRECEAEREVKQKVPLKREIARGQEQGDAACLLHALLWPGLWGCGMGSTGYGGQG